MALTTSFFSTKMYRIQYQGDLVGQEILEYFSGQIAPFSDYIPLIYGEEWEPRHTGLSFNHFTTSIAAITTLVAADTSVDETLAAVPDSAEQNEERKLFKRYFNFFQLPKGFYLSSLAYDPQNQLPLFKQHVETFARRTGERVEQKFTDFKIGIERRLNLKAEQTKDKLTELQKSGCQTPDHLLFETCVDLRVELNQIARFTKEISEVGFDRRHIAEIVLNTPIATQPLSNEPWKEILISVVASLLISIVITAIRFKIYDA